MTVSKWVLCWQAALLFLLGACASLPDPVDRPESHSRIGHQSPVAAAIQQELDEHPGQSAFRLLSDGLDAFAARVALADLATDTLDVQYYLFHDDDSGLAILDSLLKAADRGVRVRLLLDDMATAGRDASITAVDTHPNLEVRLFNPFANRSRRLLEMATHFGRVSRRMHNKSFTADGMLTIVGGRNLGNEYFSAHPDVEFGDLDVLAIGPVSADVGAEFDQYWNSELAYPVSTLARFDHTPDELAERRAELDARMRGLKDSQYGRRVRESTLVEELRERRVPWHRGEALVLADAPGKLLTAPSDTTGHLTGEFVGLLDTTRSEMLILSPYFVPEKDGVDYLTGLVRRGVRIRVLTNSLASTDVWVVHSGYAKYRAALLRGGVELYEVKATREDANSAQQGIVGSSGRASLHAKTFVMDRDRLFIGSLNLDPRSWRLNTEMGIALKSDALARMIVEWADVHLEEVAYRVELVPACRYAGDCWADETRLRWGDRTTGGVRYWEVEPQTGAGIRLLTDFVGLFPIDGQL